MKTFLAFLLCFAIMPVQAAVVTPAGVDLIIRWEVGGRNTYVKRYQRPIWPGNSASGVTIGIGYDLGHNSEEVILRDWRGHPHRGYLAAMSGFKGEPAGRLAKRRSWIVTPLDLAVDVLLDPTLIRYYNIAKRSFPGIEDMSPRTRDALISLVYNRGGNMVGRSRIEMRAIRDDCIPRRDDECVARQLEIMRRVWAGAKLGKGLMARRMDEAKHIRGRGT